LAAGSGEQKQKRSLSEQVAVHTGLFGWRMREKEKSMGLSAILVILLVLALVGVMPTWGYSSSWGYAPGGVVGLVLVMIIILALLGRI
jgi:peptidoglycan/LPS O-acetylase OafA/YrhL